MLGKIKKNFHIYKWWLIIFGTLLIFPFSWIFLSGDFDFNKYTFTTEWFKIVCSTIGMGIIVNLVINSFKHNKILFLIKEQQKIAKGILEKNNKQEDLKPYVNLLLLNYKKLLSIDESGKHSAAQNTKIWNEMEYFLKNIDNNSNNCDNAKRQIIEFCKIYSGQ
jgi:hypothetical protein